MFPLLVVSTDHGANTGQANHVKEKDSGTTGRKVDLKREERS